MKSSRYYVFRSYTNINTYLLVSICIYLSSICMEKHVFTWWFSFNPWPTGFLLVSPSPNQWLLLQQWECCPPTSFIFITWSVLLYDPNPWYIPFHWQWPLILWATPTSEHFGFLHPCPAAIPVDTLPSLLGLWLRATVLLLWPHPDVWGCPPSVAHLWV